VDTEAGDPETNGSATTGAEATGAETTGAEAKRAETEFVECPAGGRRVVRTRTVRLGDVTPSGRLRLDALARYLQDVAMDDVDDAGITRPWVLRRIALRFGELPAFRDTVELETFCSGTGARVAERRTTVKVDGEVRVETAAIWVYVDETGRPLPLEEWFFDLYGRAANSRRVSGRLRLPPPPADAARREWVVRQSDLDVFGHVNNAVAWVAVEDELARGGVLTGTRMGAAEMEYRAAIDGDDACELVSAPIPGGTECWLVVDGQPRAAVRVLEGS
jgi:acyl-ACP thioesterase